MSMRLGFVGSGAITSAIVTGLASTSSDQPSIQLSPRNSESAARLAARFLGVSVASSNQEVLDTSDVIVLAVRPQVAPHVISELRFRPSHRVISVISSFSVAALSARVAPALKVTRAVPLPSVADRRGPTPIYPPDPLVAELFGKLGVAIQVEREDEFEAFCAATATIASYFTFADTIVSWLAGHGIPHAQARDYISRIFRGLADATTTAPAPAFKVLSDEHATRGGINEQLLTHLAGHGVFKDLSQGLDAVLHRILTAQPKS